MSNPRKWSFRDLPIRIKLGILVAFSCGIALLFASVLLVTNDYRHAVASMLRQHEAMSEVLAENVAAALTFDDVTAARETLQTLRLAPSITAAAVFDERGAVLATYPSNPETVDLPPLLEVRDPRFAKSDRLELFEPIVDDGEVIGTLFLRATTEPLRQQMRRSILVVGLVMALALFFAVFLATWMQRRFITNPIQSLVSGTRSIAEGDLSARVSVASSDEIGVLCESFNVMAHNLDQALTKLHAANKELEAFSYTVSHDLRAPIRHVSGFAELLKLESESRLDRRQREHLEDIIGAATRMGRLIDDLLAFSRTSRSQLRKERVDLGRLLDQVRDELSVETAGRNVEWRITPLPEVHGDPGLLRQVLHNLVSNALKYSSARDATMIEIGTASEHDADEVVIVVRDNGVGFDMRFADKLFGVFQRLHRIEDFDGTGIGLATVRRIIAKHGGRTWAEGAVDEGAAIYFSLPKILRAEGEVHVEQEPRSSTSPVGDDRLR